MLLLSYSIWFFFYSCIRQFYARLFGLFFCTITHHHHEHYHHHVTIVVVLFYLYCTTIYCNCFCLCYASDWHNDDGSLVLFVYLIFDFISLCCSVIVSYEMSINRKRQREREGVREGECKGLVHRPISQAIYLYSPFCHCLNNNNDMVWVRMLESECMCPCMCICIRL